MHRTRSTYYSGVRALLRLCRRKPPIQLYQTAKLPWTDDWDKVKPFAYSDGLITYQHRINVVAFCDFEFSAAPYDTQVCDLQFGTDRYYSGELAFLLEKGQMVRGIRTPASGFSSAWNVRYTETNFPAQHEYPPGHRCDQGAKLQKVAEDTYGYSWLTPGCTRHRLPARQIRDE